MSTYAKFMMSSFEFASRNRREIAVILGLGHSVAVCDVQSNGGVDREGAVTIHHRRKRTNRRVWVRRPLILLDCLVVLPIHLRRLRVTCLSCHDLIALTIGWLSTVGVPKNQRPHLVYDSHEFELGRTRSKPRSKFRLALIKGLEGFLIRRCAFTIAVNDSIADRLQGVHRTKTRPLVVRSTPVTWELDQARIQGRREQFCRSLGVPMDSFVAMYHGGVVPSRGIERILEALAQAPGVVAVILGDGHPTYIETLRSLASKLNIVDRVLFHPAVSVAELSECVGAADVGVMPIQAVSENNYLSLPNKLFENIQSLTPVIGSAYPELSKVICGYDIGLTVDPTKPALIAAALQRIRTQDSLRQRFAANLPTAKAQLCWEREQEVLSEAYRRLLGIGVAVNG